MGLRMQPRSEKFFTLISKAGPNVVESCLDRRSRPSGLPGTSRALLAEYKALRCRIKMRNRA